MKKTIALLVAFVLLMSLASMPASAAEDKRAVHPAYTDGPDALNEALNVSGGTLNFVSDNMVAWGMPVWDWVVDDDGFARSHPEQTDLDPVWQEMGVETSTSGMHFTYNFKENQAVRFKVKIDCQNAPNTDYFALSISGNKPFLYTIYGQHDWTTVTVPISAGISQIWFEYNKDTSGSEGKDAVWVDDVEVVPYDHSMGLEYSEELSAALNVPGGKLEFFTPGETADEGYYPWEVKDGYAKSTNEGINCGAGNTPPSSSVLTTTIHVEEGDILYFRWRVSSESLMDRYRFYMDGGEPMESWSAVTDWAVHFCELEPGEHELMWRYDKDRSNHGFEDAAFLDDVYVGKPISATGVTIQKEATLPASRKLQLDWDVLPDTAWNREAVFASSNENVATVDRNGLVYGISEGEATITVTTKDGNFTGTCHVTVTTSEPPSNLYGFVMKRMLDNQTMYYENTNAWYNFTDLDPEDAAKLGVMPASKAGDVQQGSAVSCAELVDGVVYGYTSDGHFFTMDLDALKGESIAETDWDALDSSKVTYRSVNITGQDWNLNDMAFDYSTQTMYVVRLAGDYERGSVDVLYQVNMETGEVLENTQKEISGEGESWDAADTAYSLAIDMSGNAYVMLAGWGKMWGGNGCSRLASLDLETGKYTIIGQTTAPCFYEQAMCFDHNIGTLYWAQYAWYPDVIQLYTVDPETAELTNCGKITPKGAHVRAMFIPLCEHEQVTAVKEKAPTCTEPGMAAYWFCEDCGNYFLDEDAIEQTTPEELEIPAAGHKTEQKNKQAATCTEKGYTGDEVCTVCNEIVEKGEEIPALGHDLSVK